MSLALGEPRRSPQLVQGQVRYTQSFHYLVISVWIEPFAEVLGETISLRFVYEHTSLFNYFSVSHGGAHAYIKACALRVDALLVYLLRNVKLSLCLPPILR